MKRFTIPLIIILLAATIAPACAQPQPRRLLVIGDSLSQGLYATSEAHGYKFLVADGLGAQLGWMKGTNLAVAETNWAAWDWDADVIVVELGTNDLTGDIPEAEWPARYGAFLDALQATGARIVVGNVPWSGRDEDGEGWRLARRFSGYIEAEAGARGIPVADLWAVTLATGEAGLSQPGEPSPFAPGFEGDGYHPSDEGHRVIAEEFLRVLEPRHRFWFPLFWRATK